jgi:hypothetical protein
MERDFRQGYLGIEFPTESFRSVSRLLLRSVGLFVSNLPFLAGVTLIVYLPVKLALQLACYALDIPADGFVAYLVMDTSDLILDALVIPAAIYGLVAKFRTGRTGSILESLRWGRRQWGKTLWNKFKVEITITLWGALLIVPGLVAMVKLFLTDAIVAIEADRESDVLGRSRRLTEGHRWRIFLVVIPLMVLDLGGMWVVFDVFKDAVHSRVMMALADSLLSVGGQFTTVVGLLMYLGLVKAGPSKRSGK